MASNASNSHLVPIVVEQPARGERSYDIFSRLLKDRIIFIGQGIDEELGNTLVATMLFLDSEDQKPMSLYINCPGRCSPRGQMQCRWIGILLQRD